MSQLNRTIHVRKPRAGKVVQTALPRGHHNNGIIEVADDESDGSDSEFYDLEHEGGTIYKLPSMGIKLDFIDKVKKYVLPPSSVYRDHLADLFPALVCKNFAMTTCTTSVLAGWQHQHLPSSEKNSQSFNSMSSKPHSTSHNLPARTKI